MIGTRVGGGSHLLKTDRTASPIPLVYAKFRSIMHSGCSEMNSTRSGKTNTMKRERNRKTIPADIQEKDLQFREIGKGFIMSNPSHDMPKGRRLITAYVDQFNRSYVQVNGRYELITEQHSYLAV